MSTSKIVEFFKNFPRDQKLIYVVDLRKKFLDSEIQSLTWDCPNGWDYSAPSWVQESNNEWVLKNINSLIIMQNGNLAYYFFRENKGVN